MEAINIRHVGGESNYRLLTEPVKLTIRTEHVPTKDELRWEDDGGPAVDLTSEETVEEYHKRMMRVRGARKQRAARMYRPVESMKIVKIGKPAPVEVAEVRIAGGSEQDEKVAGLEAKIRELLGIVNREQNAEKRLSDSITLLTKKFGVARK